MRTTAYTNNFLFLLPDSDDSFSFIRSMLSPYIQTVNRLKNFATQNFSDVTQESRSDTYILIYIHTYIHTYRPLQSRGSWQRVWSSQQRSSLEWLANSMPAPTQIPDRKVKTTHTDTYILYIFKLNVCNYCSTSNKIYECSRTLTCFAIFATRKPGHIVLL